MRQMLSTLYVTQPLSYLARDGENIVVQVEGKEIGRIPIHNLENVLSFGYPGASPALMRLCAQNGVGLGFFDEHGRFLARITGEQSGNVLLRRTQYRWADDAQKTADIARGVLVGKLSNSFAVIDRGIRDHGDRVDVQRLVDARQQLRALIKQLGQGANVDGLRGIEGKASQVYFGALDPLILANKDTFFMRKRSRRPPLDAFNALLSFLYAMLAHDVRSALEGVGLDPYVGYLHRDRPGRASLAMDLMEELRPYLVDRLVLSLINRRQIAPKDVKRMESGAYYLQDEARRNVLKAYYERKQEEVMHPYLNERIHVGLIAHAQAMLLARYMRGDLDGYPPFAIR